MKKGDIVWGGTFGVLLSLLLIPASREAILQQAGNHPYVAGFIQFAILATMGDILGQRIVEERYKLTANFIGLAGLWGVIGCMVTLIFPLFAGGAVLVQQAGLLPFAGNALAQAFFGSALMNLIFTPVMNVFHRVGGIWIEKQFEHAPFESFSALLVTIDWPQMVIFNWLKIGIFFWIPVHTVVFMLPEEIRIIVAAFCSVALGVILSFAAKKAVQD